MLEFLGISRVCLPVEDDTTLVQTRKEVLEPQVSTKIASASKLNPTTEGDVGSRSAFNGSELTSMAVNNEDEERAVALARSAAERESSGRPPRQALSIGFQNSHFTLSEKNARPRLHASTAVLLLVGYCQAGFGGHACSSFSSSKGCLPGSSKPINLIIQEPSRDLFFSRLQPHK